MSPRFTRRAFLAGTLLAAAELAFRAASGLADATVPPPDAATEEALDALPLAAPGRSVAPAERMTVLQFYADWCLLSQRARPFVTRLQEAYRDAVNFQLVDIETPEGRALGDTFQIPFIPTFVVISPAGAPQAMYYSPGEVSRNASSLLPGGGSN